jgi:hypothetical protein
MSELDEESAATLLPSGQEGLVGQEEQSETKKEKTVRTLWAHFVRQLKARLRPDDRIYLGEAIEDIHEALGMLENLSAVIKAELIFIKTEPSKTNDFPIGHSPEEIALLKRLDAMRLRAWSYQVQAAVRSARVTLKIAETMGHENMTNPNFNWGADDLEIEGEIGEILQNLPKKNHFNFLDTDRAHDELTNGRLKAEPRRGLFREGCGRR